MNMSQEQYNKELARQIDNADAEIQALKRDYHACTDDVCRSQIKTFLEKKEHLFLSLLREANNGYT